MESGLALSHYKRAAVFSKNKKVLDIGSGSGAGSYFLAENGAFDVLGIDNSRSAINYAKKHFKLSNLRFELFDGLKLGVFGEKFDTICAFELIEHLPLGRPEKFLSDVYRILNKRGVFLISTPNKMKSSGENPFHTHEFTYSELLRLCKNSFKSVDLYGEICVNKDFYRVRKEVERDQRHRLAVRLYSYKILAWLLSYMPWSIRRVVSGEKRIWELGNLKFRLTKRKVEERENFLVICRK